MIEQEVLFERKLTGSYMKIAAEDCSKFDERMLLSQKIRGALPVEQCYLNEEAWYWYNISGKQSLDTYCRIREIGIAFIEKIIISICDEIEILEWSLFDLNCLLLAPEFIYINNLNQEIIFTIYPGGKEDLSQQFRELMEYLLTKVDHKDAEAVRAAYGIYEKTLDEAYGIMDIRDYIIHNRQEKDQNCDFHVNYEKYKENRKNKEGDENKEKAGLSQESPGWMAVDKKLSAQKPYSARRMDDKDAGIAETQNGKKVYAESHRVFPEIMKILNGWKATFIRGNGQENDRPDRSGTKQNKRKSEVIYAPPIQTSLRVAEDIGQTTCLSSYAAYMQGNLIYMGTENLENISLPKGEVTIGKSQSADVSINRNTISQFHAKVSFRDQEFYVEDLNSTNGTFVNEEVLPYRKMHRLQVNDIVRFADISYRFI